MALDLFYLLQNLFYIAIAAVGLLRLRLYNRNELLFFLALFVLGLAIFYLEGAPAYDIAVFADGMLLFNGLIRTHSEGRLRGFSYVVLSVIYFYLSYKMSITMIAQALFFGMLGSVSGLKEPKLRTSTSRLEISRDFVHIAFGIGFVLCFLYLNVNVAMLILMLTVLIGLMLIRYAELKNGLLGRLLSSFERKGALLGHGAQWLALGSLAVMAFVKGPFLIAIFMAIFIADPLATLAGLSFDGPRLPYNKRKSFSGTSAYFISTTLLSYPFIGMWSIPLAFVAALVESLSIGIDDNFSVAIVLTALTVLGSYLI